MQNFSSACLMMSPEDGKALNCFFPMPFSSQARIEIESEAKNDLKFYFYVDYTEIDILDENELKFHACWNRECPTKGINDKNIDNSEFEFGGKNTTWRGIIMIILENKYISLTICDTTGCIKSVYDKHKKKEYLNIAGTLVPFRLEQSTGEKSKYKEFKWEKNQNCINEKYYILKWSVKDGINIIAHVKLHENNHSISFNVEVENNTDEDILSIEYPVFGGIGNITEKGDNDFLAHSFATGVLINNPFQNFKEKWDGLRYMPYPEGFSGATMQYFTFCGKGEGGLYFAANDSGFYQKWLNFYKGEYGFLEASFIHGYEDIGPKKGIKTEYPIIIQLLREGCWYEASDIYKKWALKQVWCNKGTLTERNDNEKSVWLLENTGLTTFGINAKHDRTKWIKKYQRSINTKIFHILGPDWTRKDQTFYRGTPGGFNDWFPAKFNDENLEAIQDNNDKFAAFEFDFLISPFGDDKVKVEKSLQKMPLKIKSIDKYKFPLMCPTTDFIENLHVRKDEHLVSEYKVDAVYFDISANNILKTCMDPNHGHPIGAGSVLTKAYRKIYNDTREKMNNVSENYIPMGTEMINEVFLDQIDFYQARAGAQPSSFLECYIIRDLIKTGKASLIPMFDYVYHEYGPVRMDGWGKLVNETGDMFYYIVARTFLWGGIYELNYEYSPMEFLEGSENSCDEHYALFESRGYTFSDERAEYVKLFSKLRTGMSNKYLAYGQMLRPIFFKSDVVELKWYHYNSVMRQADWQGVGQENWQQLMFT